MRPRVSLSALLILSLTVLLIGAGWQAPRLATGQAPAAWSTAHAETGIVALGAPEQASSEGREFDAPLLGTLGDPWRVAEAPLTGVLRHPQHTQRPIDSAPSRLPRARAPPLA